MLFTGWEVRIGRLCPRSCESTARGRRLRAVLRPSAQFLPIRTDLGRWRTFLFFFPLRFKNYRKILLQLPTYVCWRRARYFASLGIFMHQGYRTHRLTKSLPIFLYGQEIIRRFCCKMYSIKILDVIYSLWSVVTKTRNYLKPPETT